MLKVSCLATVSSLTILCSAWQYFTVWLAERSVSGLFGNVLFLPPLPLDILVVGGCYSLACLQSSRLILFASCFFIPLFQWLSSLLLLPLLLYFSLFGWLSLNVFQCDWCPCLCCLIFFVYPFVLAGACGWVLDTAGHEGGSILQGLGTVHYLWG